MTTVVNHSLRLAVLEKKRAKRESVRYVSIAVFGVACG